MGNFSWVIASFNENVQIWLWLIFAVLIATFLILDLGVFNKTPTKITTKSAIKQSAMWVAIAICFGVFIYFFYHPAKKEPHEPFFEFITAYIFEYALSVDNIFVIILILRYFQVTETFYHKILFWGILGAMVFRGVFIFVGSALIGQFHFVLYFFGAFLLYTGYKMLAEDGGGEDFNPEESRFYRFIMKYLRFSQTEGNGKFFLREHGQLIFTKLFLVVILIESSDLIFAVDSIPAAFGITQDEVIIYTSNIFAVMGLRAMFFMLSGILDKFYLLQKGLSLVLMFIGLKMLLEVLNVHLHPYLTPFHVHIHPGYSLLLVLGTLIGAIVLSVIFPQKEKE